MNTNVYRRYVRRRRRGQDVPVGLLVAERSSATEFKLGYSICHSTDQFNRKEAFAVATERLVNEPIVVDLRDRDQIDLALTRLPHSFVRTADSFLTLQRGRMRTSL
jgi:hypothetical protein